MVNTSLSKYSIVLINIQDIQSTALKYLCDYTIGSCSCRRGKCQDHYHDSLESEEKLKEILRIHFKSPFQKWSDEKRRKFPWKLAVQIISIILVTTQVLNISCVAGNVPKQKNYHIPSSLYVYSLPTLLKQGFMSLTS